MKKLSPRNLRIAGIGGAVVALVLLIGIMSRANGRESSEPRIFIVTTGSIEEVVTAQGKLEPREYVDIGAQLSGQLKSIHVEIGDTVKTGELLAEIDPRIYQARVEANSARLKNLEAQRREQEATLVLSRQQLQREQKLIKALATSEQELQETKASSAVAEARVQALSAQIEEVQSQLNADRTNLEFSRILAPMDGVVVALPARPGQTLNANQTAPLILQLADLDQMTVRAQVAEADVPRITTGMAAYFSTLGQLDRKWHGTVRQVLPTPEVINEVVLFHVLIDVDNKDRALMKGMSTQVFFLIGKADNAPLVSVEALGKRLPDKDANDARAYQVNIQNGRSVEERTVLVGLMNRSLAEVKEGLQAGDRLVAQRAERVEGRQRQNSGWGGGMRGGPRL